MPRLWTFFKALVVVAMITTDVIEALNLYFTFDLFATAALLVPVFYTASSPAIVRLVALAPVISIVLPFIIFKVEMVVINLKFGLRSVAMAGLGEDLDGVDHQLSKLQAEQRREAIKSMVAVFWRPIVHPLVQKPTQELERQKTTAFNFTFFGLFVVGGTILAWWTGRFAAARKASASSNSTSASTIDDDVDELPAYSEKGWSSSNSVVSLISSEPTTPSSTSTKRFLIEDSVQAMLPLRMSVKTLSRLSVDELEEMRDRVGYLEASLDKDDGKAARFVDLDSIDFGWTDDAL